MKRARDSAAHADAVPRRRPPRAAAPRAAAPLDDALLRLVLSFLDVREHQAARGCCRDWRRLVHSLALDRLDLSARSPARAAPQLAHAAAAAMRSYQSVRRLDLSGQRSLADADLLVLASHFWPRLESLSADGCLALTDFALFSVLNAHSRRLRALSFRHCAQLSGRLAGAPVAGSHPALETLDLFDTRVDLRFVAQLEAAFPALADLNARHSPAHREWLRRQRVDDLADDLRAVVRGQLVELPLLAALLADFERRVGASAARGGGGRGAGDAAQAGVFHRSMLRAGKLALLDAPLDGDDDDRGGGGGGGGEQSSALVLAASAAGRSRALAALLELGPPALDVTDREGRTPACLAAANGHVRALELLLRHGADADARSRSLATPLFLASEHNRDVVVDLLLRHGADPSLAAAGGATALCVAARHGHLSTVRRLLAALLEPRTAPSGLAATSAGTKPQMVQALFLACESGHTRVVAELLARARLAADELMDSSVTPLYLACQMGHEAIVALLLSRGADADFRRPTPGGVSCLYIAAQEGHAAVVALLVRAEVRVDARMEDQSTALHIAARMGHVAVARALLRAGATVDAQTRSGLSPLYIASEEGHAGLVRFLLASGAARDVQTRSGATALFAATHRGHAAVVRALLVAGASAHLPKHNGTYPTDAAALLGNYDIAHLLLQFGARVGALALHFAERRRDLRLQALLMSRYFSQRLLLGGGGAAGGLAIAEAAPFASNSAPDPLTPLQS